MFTTLIESTELLPLLAQENIRVFDTRFMLTDDQWGRGQYAESHIPGAKYLHLNSDLSGPIIAGQTGRHPLPEFEEFIELLRTEGVENHDQIVVYDQSHGGIAARLWWMFQWAGHENVAVLNGGWQGWASKEMPVTAETHEFARSSFEGTEQSALVASIEQVVEMSKNSTGCLVDARASQRFLGEVEPIDPIAGHIPGAVSIPFINHVDQDGFFKSKNDVCEKFAEELNDKNDTPVFYCGSGVTACHDLLAYKHCGRGNGILYPGSWSHWITDSSRAVATGSDER